MTTMLDRWHERYHQNTTDPSCIHCAEELMSTEYVSVSIPLETAETFRATFGLNSTLAANIAPQLTCTEAEAIADMLRALDYEGSAEVWLDWHARSDDDESDLHYGRNAS